MPRQSRYNLRRRRRREWWSSGNATGDDAPEPGPAAKDGKATEVTSQRQGRPLWKRPPLRAGRPPQTDLPPSSPVSRTTRSRSISTPSRVPLENRWQTPSPGQGDNETVLAIGPTPTGQLRRAKESGGPVCVGRASRGLCISSDQEAPTFTSVGSTLRTWSDTSS